MDRAAGVLRSADVWHQPSAAVAEFVAVTRRWTFVPGVGLVGRVWARADPVWLSDVLADDNFPRGPFAAEGGLHSGFAFPIRLAGDVLGVIEFFSREVRPPDRELLSAMVSIGGQIGLFIERQRIEAERVRLLAREQAARQEAETANRAKDEFLAMLSHELRTPVYTVLGWAQMLRARAFDEAATTRALEAIERNARAQTQLIDDLLDVSRIVSGKLRLEPCPVDLAAVAKSAVEAMQPSRPTRSPCCARRAARCP
jgi:signal transduction histidine kinase